MHAGTFSCSLTPRSTSRVVAVRLRYQPRGLSSFISLLIHAFIARDLRPDASDAPFRHGVSPRGLAARPMATGARFGTAVASGRGFN